jgi:hypothetical protein
MILGKATMTAKERRNRNTTTYVFLYYTQAHEDG